MNNEDMFDYYDDYMDDYMDEYIKEYIINKMDELKEPINKGGNMKYHIYKEIEKMMLNILEEGEETILIGIEMILEPVKRFKQRNLYYIALEKLQNKI